MKRVKYQFIDGEGFARVHASGRASETIDVREAAFISLKVFLTSMNYIRPELGLDPLTVDDFTLKINHYDPC